MFTSLSARASLQVIRKASQRVTCQVSNAATCVRNSHSKNCQLPCCKGASRAYSSFAQRHIKTHSKNCQLPCCKGASRAFSSLAQRPFKAHSKGCQLPCCKVVSNQARNMSSHGPTPQWHLLGTRQSDYIQELTAYSEVPLPPGTPSTLPAAYLMQFRDLASCAIVGWILYHFTKPLQIDVEKVEVTHPQTSEKVHLLKPIAIHRDSHDLFGYDLIHAPDVDYTRLESMAAARLLAYNEEMDLWLQGADPSKFRVFSPTTALLRGRENPETYKTTI